MKRKYVVILVVLVLVLIIGIISYRFLFSKKEKSSVINYLENGYLEITLPVSEKEEFAFEDRVDVYFSLEDIPLEEPFLKNAIVAIPSSKVEGDGIALFVLKEQYDIVNKAKLLVLGEEKTFQIKSSSVNQKQVEMNEEIKKKIEEKVNYTE